ncbi:CinA family protein [Myxococcaceae bacterium GXIMD 01537]
MTDAALEAAARRLLERGRAAGVRLALAEASAGGLLCATLASLSGASAVLERAVVPYSNEAKEEWLGVPKALMVAHGAVSAEVAAAMAEGLLARSRADVALAETGIAGPGGGTEAKPVGLVYLAVARRGGETRVERHVFEGGRGDIQRATATRACALLCEGLPGAV